MSEEPSKLFVVECRSYKLKPLYVVAKDAGSAYAIARKWLDENDFGFEQERELESIKLLADEYKYTHCDAWLLVYQSSNSRKED